MKYLYPTSLLLLVALVACSSSDDDPVPDTSSSGNVSSSSSSSSGAASSSGTASSSGGSSSGGTSSSSGEASSSSSSGGSSGSVPTTAIDCTGNVVAKYDYGNQVAHSSVTFRVDGTILHEERVTVETTVVDESPLTPEKLNQLRAQVTAASLGTIVERDGSPTSLGSEAGAFEACDNGTGFVVRQVTRAAGTAGGNDTLQINESPASTTLLELAHGYAARDMSLP